MWWVTVAWAEPSEPGGTLPLVRGQVPEQMLFDKVAELGDGQVEGRGRRRRDGDYIVWELAAGTVVRWEKLAGLRVVEEHLNDASGYPLATVLYDGNGPQKAVVAGVPSLEVPLAGWTVQKVPGGSVALPGIPEERPGGGVRLDVLGGTLDIWVEPMDPKADPKVASSMDPFSDAFRDGVLAGCGCFVLDRASAWIDGRPGVRYRLLLPGTTPRDATDLWAVSIPGQGLWLMSFKVHGPVDPVAALRPARTVAALVRFHGGSP